uniref:Putative beta-tubulin polyglutamylase n=1 Tax=Lygus hesperus TaxID=30085 RepID=A0A0A9XDB2_LYGHE
MMRCEKAYFAEYYRALQARVSSKINTAVGHYFIMKPNAGCQGRGIVVTNDPLNAVDTLDHYIVQEYIARPMLVEGRKFDLRVYVLLTSIRHPSIFLFNDGLVRISAASYEPPTETNAKNTCMHLTNYAINKKSAEYIYNTDVERFDLGNKRNFRFFNQWLGEQGHDSVLC